MNEFKTPESERRRRRERYDLKTGVRGSGQYLKVRTHCSEGHPLSGDNLVQTHQTHKSGKRYTVRRCRTCSNTRRNERDRKRRREGGSSRISLCDARMHMITSDDLVTWGGVAWCAGCLEMRLYQRRDSNCQ